MPTLPGSGVQLLPFQSWQSGRGKGGRPHKLTNDYNTKEGKVRLKRTAPWWFPSRGDLMEELEFDLGLEGQLWLGRQDGRAGI